MKIKILFIALLAISLGIFYSCKDHCAHNGTCDDPLHIDYPAAYIVNGGAGTVSVIDIENHTRTKDIPVGSKPNGMVLNQ